MQLIEQKEKKKKKRKKEKKKGGLIKADSGGSWMPHKFHLPKLFPLHENGYFANIESSYVYVYAWFLHVYFSW